MSGLSKSTGSQGKTNCWWYTKHGNNKNRKRKKQLGTTQDNIDKSNAQGKITTEGTEKELEVKKKRITEAGTGAIKTDSKPDVIMSKQARKRKLKREAAKQEKLEKKKKKLELKGQGTFGKDKEQVRTGGEQKRKMKRFKRRGRKRKNDLEGSLSHPVVAAREMSPVDRDTSNNIQSSTLSKQKKRSGVNAGKSEKGVKVPVTGKTQIDSDASRSGDKALDTDRVIEVDENWMAFMKKINYKPPKRNLTEEHRQTKLAKTEAGLKRQQEIWFDDVDPELIEGTEPLPGRGENRRGNPDLMKGETPSTRLTKYIGIDCEMVGIGPNGQDHMLARVSLVNQHGACIYDKFVAPSEAITDYRSSVSGITPEKLKDAEDFATVQNEVHNIIKSRILVGHAVQNDLKVLFLSHQRSKLRDTSTYKPFQDLSKTKRPSLKQLSRMILDVGVQRSSHDSVEDAQAAMKLFMLHRQAWEKDMVKTRKNKTKKQKKQETDTR